MVRSTEETVLQNSHLVHVVGKLPLCDGPWPLVVALECCNLLAKHWGVGIT